MVWVKKIKDSWHPQEFPNIVGGDHVNFPGSIQKLIEDGDVTLCDKDGNEVSTYDTLGIITDSELEEFRLWRKGQAQEGLKKSLEKDQEELLAEAQRLKKEISNKKNKMSEEDRKAFGQKMADARKKKAEEKARRLVEVKEIPVSV